MKSENAKTLQTKGVITKSAKNKAIRKSANNSENNEKT
jgi:hypothetical protein